VAQSQEHLGGLPADPVALLGDMPQKYNIAARLMVQNVPEELRRMAIDEIKIGMERGLPQARSEDRRDRSAAGRPATNGTTSQKLTGQSSSG
jgi:hypothetical protein